jgi:hypothetical protein
VQHDHRPAEEPCSQRDCAQQTASFSMRPAPPVLEANDVNASEGTVCIGDELIWLCMR